MGLQYFGSKIFGTQYFNTDYWNGLDIVSESEENVVNGAAVLSDSISLSSVGKMVCAGDVTLINNVSLSTIGSIVRAANSSLLNNISLSSLGIKTLLGSLELNHTYDFEVEGSVVGSIFGNSVLSSTIILVSSGTVRSSIPRLLLQRKSDTGKWLVRLIT